MQGLTTGQLAKEAGVGPDSIRFYETKRLLPSPSRSPSGYRYFPQSAVRRVALIKGAQRFGFSLEEVRELMALRTAPDATCRDIGNRAELKIREIDDDLRSLRATRKALGLLAAACSAAHSVTECSMLSHFEHSGRPASGDRAGSKSPHVDLVYFSGCPHVGKTRVALAHAMRQAGLNPVWKEWNSADARLPRRLRGYPSPTILVEGHDVSGARRAATHACRISPGDRGQLEPTPSAGALARAFRRWAKRGGAGWGARGPGAAERQAGGVAQPRQAPRQSIDAQAGSQPGRTATSGRPAGSGHAGTGEAEPLRVGSQ